MMCRWIYGQNDSVTWVFLQRLFFLGGHPSLIKAYCNVKCIPRAITVDYCCWKILLFSV